MAYIDATYITGRIGADTYAALFTDAGVVNAAAQAALLADVSGAVDAKLQLAGYAVPLATTPDIVAKAAFGVWIQLAYGRKGLEVPATYDENMRACEGIGTGEYAIPGVEPVAANAVGGVSSSPILTTTGRPPIFDFEFFRRGGW